MLAVRGRDNAREKALRSELHRRGLRFRLHRALIDGNRRRTVDIVLPGTRIAVFLDGCFWHGCPTHGTTSKSNAQWWQEKIDANRLRDRDTNRRLRALGWTVLRVWEHEPIGRAADAIERSVSKILSRPGRSALVAAIPPKSTGVPGNPTKHRRARRLPPNRTGARTRAKHRPPSPARQ
jgi:DNA mismatch endonuclease (patch repair protein)